MGIYYSLILFFHVFSATLSIGPFFVLVPLIRRMRQSDRRLLDDQLATFQSGVRIVKHAGHVLVATGILLVLSSGYTWTTSWVLMTILVMVGSIFFLASAFKPIIRKLRDGDGERGDLLQVLNRKLWTYIFLLLAMLYFMVVKPNLW